VDLWGQIGSRVQAEGLRADSTLADYQTTELTLSAEVARTWFALIEAHAQIALLEEQVETNLTVLDLQEARFGLGQIRLADVLRQRQLVESTREQAVVARSRVALLEHVLAVLQGRAPQEAGYDTGSVLPSLPPLPDTGLPAELVNRRPDVRRELLALEAADRDLASAITAQYPRLNLTASVTTAAESPENLFRDWLVSIAGQLIGPLFDGGERRAEVDRTAAVVRERVADYGQTVLVAYREVEDALALERYQRERIELLNIQLDLARQSSVQLREQYIFFGDETDFLDVLSATTEEQRLQRETLSARLDLVLTRIALYLALAGDFESIRPDRGGGRAPEPMHAPEPSRALGPTGAPEPIPAPEPIRDE
jgi:outer membrane protein TolC